MKSLGNIILLTAALLATALGMSADTPDDRENEVKMVLKKVQNSIVKVVSQSHSRTVASGIVIDPDHVISSYLVVAQPYSKIIITTVSGESWPAKLVGADSSSKLALLKTEEKKLQPLKTGKRSETGDWVALVGVFYEKFPVINQGIVSSANEDQLLLNAPVAPGYAGGAAVNRNGEFTGVILGRFGYSVHADYTVKGRDAELLIQSPRSLNQELSFAVPAARVMEIANELKKYGKVRRGWLGITLTTAEGVGQVQVQDVADNSPAQKAGLLSGDLILSFQNKPIISGDDVSRIVRAMKPGERVQIVLKRGDTRKSLQAHLAEADLDKLNRSGGEGMQMKMIFPEFKDGFPRVDNFLVKIRSSRSLGIDAMELSANLAKKMNVEKGYGLLVTRLFAGTAAENVGLREGDILVMAEGREIRKNSDLHNLLDEMEDGEALNLHFYRDGKPKQVRIKPDRNTEGIFGHTELFWESLRNFNNGQPRDTGDNKGDNKGNRDKQLEQYKKELEQMRKNQLLLMKQMEEMQKRMEEKNKTEKKEKAGKTGHTDKTDGAGSRDKS